MEPDQLNKLVQRYLNGESTLEEEQALREALAQPEGAKAYPVLAATFAGFEQEAQIQAVEPAAGWRYRNSTDESSRWSNRWWIGAAAAVLLSLGVWSLLPGPETNPNRIVLSEAADQEEAYEQTREALLMLSNKLNRGVKPAQKLERFHRSTNRIQSSNTP